MVADRATVLEKSSRPNLNGRTVHDTDRFRGGGVTAPASGFPSGRRADWMSFGSQIRLSPSSGPVESGRRGHGRAARAARESPAPGVGGRSPASRMRKTIPAYVKETYMQHGPLPTLTSARLHSRPVCGMSVRPDGPSGRARRSHGALLQHRCREKFWPIQRAKGRPEGGPGRAPRRSPHRAGRRRVDLSDAPRSAEHGSRLMPEVRHGPRTNHPRAHSHADAMDLPHASRDRAGWPGKLSDLRDGARAPNDLGRRRRKPGARGHAAKVPRLRGLVPPPSPHRDARHAARIDRDGWLGDPFLDRARAGHPGRLWGGWPFFERSPSRSAIAAVNCSP